MGCGPNRSQMACNAAGSAQEANPLDSSVNPTPAAAACRFAHSCPLIQIFIGYGKYELTLMNAPPIWVSHR